MNAPPPISTPTPLATPKLAAPASWLPTADRIILLLVVVLAGLSAAYVSRNSDQWLHFAAGRDLFKTYSLGSDPYSYTAADRTWVNHSWLYDFIVYQLYSLNETGSIVIAAKATLFALTFLLAFSIRKPEQPGWPWWLIGIVAVLAAAPHTLLRPAIVSAFFTAFFLRLLIRSRWNAGSWRNPLILAGVCALWANLDAWFLLGPLMITASLFGEVLHRSLIKSEEPAPALSDLVKALLLCLAATLINPHHVRVWELPIELTFGLPEAVKADETFLTLNLSPLSNNYYNRAYLGSNLNGVAFGLLIVLGGLLLAIRRVRISLLLLWVVFAAFAILHYRAILFFAVAAIPLAAIPLSDVAIRFAAIPQTKTFSPLLRLIGGPAVLLMMACAWPGWLHPKPGDPAHANRVALGVEPDHGLARAAKVLHGWRMAKKLPDEMHGAPITVEMANHIAWFAPGEKVAFNARFKHHLPELPAFLAARTACLTDAPGSPVEALSALRAKYTILNRGAGQVANVPQAFQINASGTMALWHLDGRVTVLGMRDADRPVKFDIVAAAFDPKQAPLLKPMLADPPPRTRTPYDDFADPVRPQPLETLDALAYQDYARNIWSEAAERHQRAIFFATGALTGMAAAVLLDPRTLLPATPDEALAANLLAQRSARQAIARNPDHFMAYFALATSADGGGFQMPGFAAEEQETQQATALRQLLTRMPLPSAATKSDSQLGTFAAEMLANILLRRQMVDLYRDTKRLASDYKRRYWAFGDAPPDVIKAELEKISKELQQIDDECAARLEKYQQVTPGAPAERRLQIALQLGLPGEALKVLQTANVETDFGNQGRTASLFGVQLRLKAGFLEDAVAVLGALKPPATAADDPFFLTLYAEAQRLTGDFAGCAQSLDVLHRRDPLPPDLQGIVRKSMGSQQDYELHRVGTLAGALGGWRGALAQQAAEGWVLDGWMRDVDWKIRRAMLPLFQGDLAEARNRFQQSLSQDGVAVPEFLPHRAVAERYIRLIDTGQKAK